MVTMVQNVEPLPITRKRYIVRIDRKWNRDDWFGRPPMKHLKTRISYDFGKSIAWLFITCGFQDEKFRQIVAPDGMRRIPLRTEDLALQCLAVNQYRNTW